MRGTTVSAGGKILTATIRGVELTAFLHESSGGHQILSPLKFIEMMGMDIDSFAGHAHVHRSTVIRAPAAESVQSHIRMSLQVLAAVAEASGDDLQAAIFWYRNEPLASFAYKTAESMVAGGRATEVIDLLESFQAGFVG